MLGFNEWLMGVHEMALARSRAIVARWSPIRGDTKAATVGVLIEVVLVYMVLFLILAAVFKPVDNALKNYAANETTMGPVIHSVWWILIGAGILLGMIYTLLRVGRETGA